MVEAASHLRRKPSEYFATNCFMGGPLDLRASYEVGTPNVMFGADIPHAEGTSPYTHEVLRYVFSDVSEPEVRRITSVTAAHVYNFNLDELQRVADRCFTGVSTDGKQASILEKSVSLMLPRIVHVGR
jgi:hypothetical protein